MPSHPDRVRAAGELPSGYQFGWGRFHFVMVSHPSLPEAWPVPCVPSANSRDQVDGRADRPSLPGGDREPGVDSWNVIEGEHFDSDAERHPVITGARSDA